MSNRTFVKSIIAVAVVGLLTVGLVEQGTAQGRSDWALQRAMDVQEDHTNVLLTKRGVMGTGVGYNAAGEPAIKVFVQTQADVAGFPQAIDDVPVDVEVTGMFVALHHRPGHGGGGGDPPPPPAEDCQVSGDPTARCARPVPIGVSTGHPDITAGTIGCRVKDAAGNVYALSNNHVYADSNDASFFDPVIQPGTFDGGSSPDDDIGVLFDFEPIDFSGGDNIMDAAIALSSVADLGTSTLSNGYGTPGVTPVDAALSQAVQKYGRTTNLTKGTVTTINAIVNVCYETRGPFRCVKLARFVGQILITPGGFSAGGDSGALIVTDDDFKNPVGLLFAGSSTHTIANPIGPVLARFLVTIDNGN